MAMKKPNPRFFGNLFRFNKGRVVLLVRPFGGDLLVGVLSARDLEKWKPIRFSEKTYMAMGKPTRFWKPFSG